MITIYFCEKFATCSEISCYQLWIKSTQPSHRCIPWCCCATELAVELNDVNVGIWTEQPPTTTCLLLSVMHEQRQVFCRWSIRIQVAGNSGRKGFDLSSILRAPMSWAQAIPFCSNVELIFKIFLATAQVLSGIKQGMMKSNWTRKWVCLKWLKSHPQITTNFKTVMSY